MELRDWLQVITIVASVATMAGYLKSSMCHLTEKIDRLEIKQDKHNNLIERMVIVEQSIKSAHKRLDERED